MQPDQMDRYRVMDTSKCIHKLVHLAYQRCIPYPIHKYDPHKDSFALLLILKLNKLKLFLISTSQSIIHFASNSYIEFLKFLDSMRNIVIRLNHKIFPKKFD